MYIYIDSLHNCVIMEAKHEHSQRLKALMQEKNARS